ncbi:MAG: hypothetical protein AVDCRST_MAG19-2435, partial [uncultured Thermomicrobiales bacterium]
ERRCRARPLPRLLAQPRRQGGPRGPPGLLRLSTRSPPVRGEGDGDPCADLPPRRAPRPRCLVARWAPPRPLPRLPVRARRPPRPAVPDRHRRQRPQPLRHGRVVGRRQPPRQLGDPDRRLRPVPPPAAGRTAYPRRPRRRLRRCHRHPLGARRVRRLPARFPRAPDRLHRHPRRPRFRPLRLGRRRPPYRLAPLAAPPRFVTRSRPSPGCVVPREARSL